MLHLGTWSWTAKMGSPITIKPVPFWAAHQKQRAAAAAPDEHILNHILTCHTEMLWHAKAAPSHRLRRNQLKKDGKRYRSWCFLNLNELSFDTEDEQPCSCHSQEGFPAVAL